MTYTPSPERYENNTFYKRCGNSGLLLPRLSLGLWHNFGDTADGATSSKLITGAFDRGITHFDLANNYGPPPGSAEKRMGHILNQELKAYRDELIISTKAGYDMWEGPYGNFGSRKYLTASLDQSLKRLGLEYVDIFYHHRPDPETPLEETMGALAHAVKSGKALYVGISNYRAEDARKAIHILKELGTPCLINQPRYNMLDRWVEDGLLDLLSEEGVGCIPFSPLAQGILTGRYLQGIPADSRAAGTSHFLNTGDITAERIRMLQTLNALATKRGQSLAQMALAWILRRPEVTTVLIGASKLSQIDDNLGALNNGSFSPEELKQIDLAIRQQ
ncbi:MAG: L-glyceraldehyde 3-phosphate reductase [Opitutales bacterium]|nr:L-glyceraldehyde 3-phosphate reductase [Opitutales bacterium]